MGMYTIANSICNSILFDVVCSIKEEEKKASANWRRLPSSTIHQLVVVLKTTRRWSRDGRSLRLLNKHWCLELNRHILSVHPHKSRIVVKRDISSLRKFTNLTSLDITPFITLGRGEHVLVNYYAVMKVLPDLTELMHLQISKDVLSMIPKEVMKRVFGPISVHVVQGSITDWHLRKLMPLQLEELSATVSVKDLTLFLARTPSMRKLDAWITEPKSSAEVMRLGALDDVTLRVDGSVNGFIAEVTSLVSLDISCCGVSSIEPLVSLPKLKHLVLNIDARLVLIGTPFKQLMHKLASLVLRSLKPDLHLPTNLLRGAETLESLSLQDFKLNGSALLSQHPRSLLSLSLKNCSLTHGCSFLDAWSPLTSLSLIRIGELPSQLSVLSNLKNLELNFREHQNCSQTLEEILCLKQLETLKFHGWVTLMMQVDFPQSSFEALGNLPMLAELFISGHADRAVLYRIQKTAFLTKLETLTLELILKQSERVWFECLAQTLKIRSPNLKLEVSAKLS